VDRKGKGIEISPAIQKQKRSKRAKNFAKRNDWSISGWSERSVKFGRSYTGSFGKNWKVREDCKVQENYKISRLVK
jgi:hypothetical protein